MSETRYVPAFFVTHRSYGRAGRESPYSTEEHPYRYVAVTSDGDKVAEGTCRGFGKGFNPGGDAWELALEYHEADVGATDLLVYDRATNAFKEKLP